MAQEITIPDSPNAIQKVILDDTKIEIQSFFNTRNNSWYLNIFSNNGGELILGGVKLIPSQSQTGRYFKLDFPSGNLWCLRVQGNIGDYLDRTSFSDGNYGLYYISRDEELEFGLAGI